jgi:hypothetical protein
MGESVDLHIGGYHMTEAIDANGRGSVFKANNNRVRRTER